MKKVLCTAIGVAVLYVVASISYQLGVAYGELSDEEKGRGIPA